MPLRRGASGTARASTDPAPPTQPTPSTTRRPRRPGTAPSSTATTRASDAPSSERKRQARYPPPYRQAPMPAPRLFPNNMESIPELRINWSGTQTPAPTYQPQQSRQPRPIRPRIVRQGRSRSPPRVGRTQRNFHGYNYRDV